MWKLYSLCCSLHPIVNLSAQLLVAAFSTLILYYYSVKPNIWNALVILIMLFENIQLFLTRMRMM